MESSVGSTVHVYQIDSVRIDNAFRLAAAGSDRALMQPGAAVTVVEASFWTFDASRLWTFFFAIALVVYGSLRSMRVEQENNDDSKEEKSTTKTASSPSGQPAAAAESNDNVTQTIDSCQALFLPFGASASLLLMFYFFDSLQMLFTVCTGLLAMVAFAFLLMPVCQWVMRPMANTRLSFCCFGRFSPAQILSVAMSVTFVCVWLVTGHWLLMDILGMGLCVSFIAFIRLPSLKVSTMLLVGLLLYDLFWVFCSSYLFSTNVMMRVATRPADNPVAALVKKLNLSSSGENSPKLSLPGKLVFPSMYSKGNFSMLGLGDIVMPGLLLCFVMRYDMSRKGQCYNADAGLPPPSNYYQRIKYFHCSLIGYFLGLLTATVSSEVFNVAQPALLYLVPFTLLPLVIVAYLRGDLRRMWSEPFQQTPLPKYLNV